MKCIKFIILYILFLISANLKAQDNITEIKLQKGEILDILLLRNNSDIAVKFELYKKTAFPVAMEHSYKPLPGLNISRTIFGNISPEALIFGKWDNKILREDFIDIIDQKVPNFHEMRKDIWNCFYLTYYEMESDLTINIDKEKYLVASAFWGNDESSIERLVDDMERDMIKSKAKTVIRLGHGISPFGYYYAPDQFVISAWPNKSAFEAFQNTQGKPNQKVLTNFQQFEL